MANIIISVKNLVKNYGTFNAVKDISFDVYEGEIFGLLGPNGAGKSTTLEIIETLRQKTSGDVTVCGMSLDNEPDNIKKIIGVQLQTSGYYPGLTLVELIQLFGGLYNENVNPLELLKLVNLTDKAKNKYKELSGGQKQRFSIATTLINRPKIIFRSTTERECAALSPLAGSPASSSDATDKRSATSRDILWPSTSSPVRRAPAT